VTAVLTTSTRVSNGARMTWSTRIGVDSFVPDLIKYSLVGWAGPPVIFESNDLKTGIDLAHPTPSIETNTCWSTKKPATFHKKKRSISQGTKFILV
jgi:hypothetical protein